MFIAHYLAGWLGIPTAIVIAALFILRKKGKALRARRQQARLDQRLDRPGAGPATAGTRRGRP